VRVDLDLGVGQHDSRLGENGGPDDPHRSGDRQEFLPDMVTHCSHGMAQS